MAEKEKEKNSSPKEKKVLHPGESSPLEWVTAAIGILLVSGVIGFLLYRGATKGDTPPTIKIQIESVKPTGESYLVNFRAINTGDTTAAAVTIEGELKNGEKSEETSDISLTYVPAHSERRGGLIFTKNPNDYQLQIRAKGYEQP
jgi:uncharacterized protein (TIGR02588 family)